MRALPFQSLLKAKRRSPTSKSPSGAAKKKATVCIMVTPGLKPLGLNASGAFFLYVWSLIEEGSWVLLALPV